ncbi:MAG: hypothetical protein WC455_02600 [Dehalococcoidia bacterium]|jgi:hypothetical protein
MSDDNKPVRKRKLVRLVWLVPLLVVAIILYINFLPLGGSPEHIINVGGSDTDGKAHLTAPLSGFSDELTNDSVSYREITGDTVYFELTDPRLSQADEVAVAVKFIDNFPEDSIFVIGAQDDDGYSLRYAYVPFYEQLDDLPLVTSNGSVMVYATDTENEPPLETVMDPLRNPPLGSLIASGDPTLNINRLITPQEYINMQFGEFDAEGALAELIPDEDEEYDALDSSTVLLGPQEFYLYSNGGEFEVTIEKRDLNRNAGMDHINVHLYAPDGTLAASDIIRDDFDFTEDKVLGQKQHCYISLPNTERGVYRLEIASSAGDSDFIITHLSFNQGRMIAEDRLYLAGNTYVGKEPGAIFVWCYLAGTGEVRFTTSEEMLPQMVTVTGANASRMIFMNQPDTWYSTGMLEPGIYRVKAGKGDITVDAPQAIISLTRESLFIPSFNSIEEGKGRLDINTALRGGHTFWTYVENGALEMSVTKQDMNLYEGADGLTLKVYDIDGNFISETAIPDDGDAAADGSFGPIQTETLSAANLSAGSYRIEMTGGDDLLIEGIEINQAKFVVDNKILPVGTAPGYVENSSHAIDGLSLYTDELSLKKVSFFYWHGNSMQQIAISGDGFYTELDVNEIEEWLSVDLVPGAYRITVPKQDIRMEFNGYLSFTPDSFFLPRRCEVTGLESYVSDFKEYVDYIVVNYDDYYVTTNYDGWLTARAKWNTADLSIIDDTLSFCLIVPHLDRAGDEDKTIPVDSITIELNIPPFWK